MKRVLLAANFIFLLALVLFSLPAGAQDPASSAPRDELLRLEIKGFWCMDDRYHIEFSVINRYDYEIRPSVAFKLFDKDVLFAVKTVVLDVPAGADGSDTREVSIEETCRGGTVDILGKVFHPRDSNRVRIWLNQSP